MGINDEDYITIDTTQLRIDAGKRKNPNNNSKYIIKENIRSKCN